MKTQFVTDNDGNKLGVFFTMKEYLKIIEDLEELEDLRLFDEAEKEEQEFIKAEQAFQEIEQTKRKV